MFYNTTCNADVTILWEMYWSLMLSFQYIDATLFYENTSAAVGIFKFLL